LKAVGNEELKVKEQGRVIKEFECNKEEIH
jgi:hypothetical protein